MMLKRLFARLFTKRQASTDPFVTGEARPPIVPDNWIGEALPESQGWSWTNPDNRGDCVRIYDAAEPYVVVTKDGMVIGPDGEPTGDRLDD